MRLRSSTALVSVAMLVFVARCRAGVSRRSASTASRPAPTAFDSRAKTVATPTAAQRDAVAALVGAAGAGTRVTWDHRFGTPRTIVNAKGYLSGPSAGAPVDVARAWVDAHRAAFGLSAGDVQALAVTRDHALPGHRHARRRPPAGGRGRADGGRRPADRRGHRQRPRAQLRRQRGAQPRRPGRRVRAQRGPGAGQGRRRARARRGLHAQPERHRRPATTSSRAARSPPCSASGRRRSCRPAARGRPIASSSSPSSTRPTTSSSTPARARCSRAARSSRYDSEGSVYENFPGAPAGRHAGHQELRAHARVARRLHGPDRHGRGRRPDDVRQQRQHVRQLLELPRPRRPGPAPGQPDEPVRLPVRDELAAHERRDGAAVLRAGPRPGRHEPVLAAQPHPRRVLRPRLHRDRRQLPAQQLRQGRKRRRRGPRPRARRRGQRRRSHLHRPRQRVLPRACPTASRRGAACSCGSRSTTPSRARSRTATSTPPSSSTSTPTACRRATSPAARRSAPSSRARWARAGATGTRSTTSTTPGCRARPSSAST